MMNEMPEAWVRIPSNEEIYPRVQQSQSAARVYDFGFTTAMARLQMAHPRFAARFGPLFYEIMFAPGALERSEREMVASVAAAAQDCHY